MKAKRTWCSAVEIAQEMRHEAHSEKLIETIVNSCEAQAHLVREYLFGRIVAPLRNTIGPAPAGPAGDAKHKFLLRHKYDEHVASGAKDVEGRICSGAAAAVQVGDTLQLGRSMVYVRWVHSFA